MYVKCIMIIKLIIFSNTKLITKILIFLKSKFAFSLSFFFILTFILISPQGIILVIQLRGQSYFPSLAEFMVIGEKQ